MTLRLVNARLPFMGLAVTAVMLAGCGGSSANSTGSHQALENAMVEAPASPEPPTATPPPTPTPLPPGLEVKPVEVPQGGAAIVYLNDPAASATVTFGGRQYPMLHNGERWWAMIGLGALATPGPASVTATYAPAGGGAGQSSVTKSITIVDREFPIEYIQLAPSTAALLAPATVQEELNRRAAVYSSYTTERMWHGPFERPARGEITGIYGEGRSYNGAPATDYHRGTDFTGTTGDPVFAAAAGRVVFTGELKVRGNAIMVDHGAGLFTAYHHLSAFYVAEGDFVTPGQQIGAIGSTGLATGSHLHWEVVVRGVEVDGQLWLESTELVP